MYNVHTQRTFFQLYITTFYTKYLVLRIHARTISLFLVSVLCYFKYLFSRYSIVEPLYIPQPDDSLLHFNFSLLLLLRAPSLDTIALYTFVYKWNEGGRERDTHNDYDGIDKYSDQIAESVTDHFERGCNWCVCIGVHVNHA